MAVFGLGVMLGPILGPTLGGWLTDSYSWRWVFYVNVPFGILCALGILLFLGRRADRPLTGRLDWLGFATLGLGIGALQLFLDRGERLDWFASHEIQLEAALLRARLLSLHRPHPVGAESVHRSRAIPRPEFRDRHYADFHRRRGAAGDTDDVDTLSGDADELSGVDRGPSFSRRAASGPWRRW